MPTSTGRIFSFIIISPLTFVSTEVATFVVVCVPKKTNWSLIAMAEKEADFKYESTATSTIDDDATIFTPPESDAGTSYFDAKFSSVPRPDATFFIYSIACGRVITLIDGQIKLAKHGSSHGSPHWKCVETDGWLGFLNTASGSYLGHDKNQTLCCTAKKHLKWERFCVRMNPGRGYVLLMTHWSSLWHVGFSDHCGIEKLAKIGPGQMDGAPWAFIEVDPR